MKKVKPENNTSMVEVTIHEVKNHEVKRLFEEINKKTKASPNDKPNLVNEFKELRDITDNYRVPNDVCESYEGVYKMLEEVDEAYQG